MGLLLAVLLHLLDLFLDLLLGLLSGLIELLEWSGLLRLLGGIYGSSLSLTLINSRFNA